MATLNCQGKLVDLSKPVVMGILNVTPDSFYDGGRYTDEASILRQSEKILSEGAAILDVGGMSSRPGADVISEAEELSRTIPTIELILKYFPETIISIDTVHSTVARAAVNAGANIVNDISGGNIDDKLLATVAELGVPYILMHLKGLPKTMQQLPEYQDVTIEVLKYFIEKIKYLRALGVKDIVLDVGFGFGKTLEHNYQLLKQLHIFKILECPILAGISRKSMIYKLLNISPTEALPASSALHLFALQQGATILRTHDVKEAKQTIQLWHALL